MSPSPPPADDADADKGPVLGPEELDIERRENVIPIDEGRYVITRDERAAERAAAIAAGRMGSRIGDATDDEDADDPDAAERVNATGDGDGSGATALSSGAVERWQERTLLDADAHYGLRLSAKSGDEVTHGEFGSDDVATVFDGLITWYAEQLDREMPVEKVIGILLAESNVRVRYPGATIRDLLAIHDLSLDDTIADLFEATADDDGVVLVPEGDGSEFLVPDDGAE